MTLNIQTISTQASQNVTVDLGCQAQEVLIKNFSASPIWVGIDPDATQTEGMAQIPSDSSQILTANKNGSWKNMSFNTLYVYAEAAESNCVEIQPIKW